MMCARCVSAVRTEMKSIVAISWFVWPSARSRSTSRSRSESGSASARAAASASAAASRAPSAGWTYRSPAATCRNAVDELGVGGLLEDVAGRAGREGLPDVAGVVLHREHEHLRVGRLLEDVRGRLDPALVGQDDVHQDDVRLVLSHLEDRIAGVPGLGDGLEAVLGVEQHPQPGADDRVVVHDDDADAHQIGNLDDDRRPGRRRLDVERPPTRATRSRMPMSPRPSALSSPVENPRPSSSITAVTLPGLALEDDAHPLGRACFTMFVSASWTTR